MITINNKQYPDIKKKLCYIMTAVFVGVLIVTFFAVYFLFYYVINYENNVKINRTYEYLKQHINYDVFNYPFKNGKEIDAAFDNMIIFNNIKSLMSVNSMYVLEITREGEIIYTSGYSDKLDVSSYYYAGRKVPDVINDYAKRAFEENKVILSKKPLNEDGIKGYMCIYPINIKDKLVGAICVNFDFEENRKLSSVVLKCTGFFSIILLILFYKFISIIFNKAIYNITSAIVYRDNLTGLQNRLAYEEKLEKLNKEIGENSSDKYKFCILIYDLNNLKKINDTLGHLAGDKYIYDSARIINNCFESVGVTYRIGGDEFATVIMYYDKSVIEKSIDLLNLKQEDYNKIQQTIDMSISYGIDYYKYGQDLNTVSIIKRADEKMYKMKREKKLKG